MRTKKQDWRKEVNKPLCEVSGHAFQSTTSDTYQVCTRSACHVAQRLVAGQWINVQQAARAEKQKVQAPAATLWDTTAVEVQV